jgi:hypothetical protein
MGEQVVVVVDRIWQQCWEGLSRRNKKLQEEMWVTMEVVDRTWQQCWEVLSRRSKKVPGLILEVLLEKVGHREVWRVYSVA